MRASAKLADEWTVLERGINRWIESKHLETIVLEVYTLRRAGLESVKNTVHFNEKLA